MHGFARWTTLIAICVIGLAVGTAAVQAKGPYDIHTARGKLTAVDLQWKAVVVEVPLKNQQLTVAGELVPNAKIMKNGHMAALQDFTVDRPVTVKWMVTDKGLNILELHQK